MSAQPQHRQVEPEGQPQFPEISALRIPFPHDRLRHLVCKGYLTAYGGHSDLSSMLYTAEHVIHGAGDPAFWRERPAPQVLLPCVRRARLRRMSPKTTGSRCRIA